MEFEQNPTLLSFFPSMKRSFVAGDGLPVVEGIRGDGKTWVESRIDLAPGLWVSGSIMISLIPNRVIQTDVAFNCLFLVSPARGVWQRKPISFGLWNGT